MPDSANFDASCTTRRYDPAGANSEMIALLAMVGVTDAVGREVPEVGGTGVPVGIGVRVGVDPVGAAVTVPMGVEVALDVGTLVNVRTGVVVRVGVWAGAQPKSGAVQTPPVEPTVQSAFVTQE